MLISRRQYRRLKRQMNPDGSWKRPRWRPYRSSFLRWSLEDDVNVAYAHTYLVWGKHRFRPFGKPKRFFSPADSGKVYQLPDFGALNSGLPDRTDWSAVSGW